MKGSITNYVEFTKNLHSNSSQRSKSEYLKYLENCDWCRVQGDSQEFIYSKLYKND